MRRTVDLLAGAVVLFSLADLSAQSTMHSPQTFEAASIKVNRSGARQAFQRVLPGGRFTATNLGLLPMIRFAYAQSPRSRGLEPFEVRGGPAWAESDRFDVNATAGRDVSLTELRMMVRAMLEDRFQLKVHYDTRQLPVYRMVLADGGKLGSQLRRTEADCAIVPIDPLRGTTPGVAEPCGYFGPSPRTDLSSGRAYQAFRGLKMEDLALTIYPYLGRRVIDGTGLSGYFDGDFEFTAEIVMPPPLAGFPNPYDGRVLPSVFSVLPQQLGLTLQSERGPVEILVIDRAEQPSEN